MSDRYDVEPARAYRESLGPNPPPIPPELKNEDDEQVSWQQPPPIPPDPPPVKKIAAPKAAPAVSIPALIDSLKQAGLSADKILEIIAASTR